MKIEIADNLQDGTYTAKIWDGPDGVDYRDFLCSSLGECMEQIIQFRIFNSLSYFADDSELQADNYS
jgi:hypothetical protein